MKNNPNLLKNQENYSIINLVSITIFIGFLLAALQIYINAIYNDLPYPHNTFLFYPGVRFTDLTGLASGCADLNPYFQENFSAQLPFANFLAFLFSKVPMPSMIVLFVILIMAPIFLVYYHFLSKTTDQAFLNSCIISAMNYPVLFTLDRGNLEGIVFLFIFLGITSLLLYKGVIIPIMCLGFAIALKGYPLIFLFIAFVNRSYIVIYGSIIFATLLSFVSLASFSGGFLPNMLFLFEGKNFTHHVIMDIFISNPLSVQRGVSLFTTFKVLIGLWNPENTIDYKAILPIYKTAAAFMSVPMLALAYGLRQLPWKCVYVITAAAVLLPHLSAHYKLILFLLPLLLFIISEKRRSLDLLYAFLFGLLLIPKPYLYLTTFSSDSPGRDISIAVIIDPLIIVSTLLLFLFEMIFLHKKTNETN